MVSLVKTWMELCLLLSWKKKGKLKKMKAHVYFKSNMTESQQSAIGHEWDPGGDVGRLIDINQG